MHTYLSLHLPSVCTFQQSCARLSSVLCALSIAVKLCISKENAHFSLDLEFMQNIWLLIKHSTKAFNKVKTTFFLNLKSRITITITLINPRIINIDGLILTCSVFWQNSLTIYSKESNGKHWGTKSLSFRNDCKLKQPLWFSLSEFYWINLPTELVSLRAP